MKKHEYSDVVLVVNEIVEKTVVNVRMALNRLFFRGSCILINESKKHDRTELLINMRIRRMYLYTNMLGN